MTGGTICASEKIIIGDRVTVGANSTIVDTDFHPLQPNLRQAQPQGAEGSAVTIEDDVFIGMNCLILKGVTIGYGSVIGAGSVVTQSVPASMVVAGNPAKVIRKNNS
jgi:acetyltransferase-like isoleucine patch superfamily enzyme